MPGMVERGGAEQASAEVYYRPREWCKRYVIGEKDISYGMALNQRESGCYCLLETIPDLRSISGAMEARDLALTQSDAFSTMYNRKSDF